MNAILNRRSVREFDLSKRILKEDLEELCRLAEAAPSARNQRGREYIIIDDLEVIKNLSLVSPGAAVVARCNTVIAVLGKNPKEISTPHMQPQDLACAVENILIAATEHNWGSCYIGIYPLEDRMKACDSILGVKNNAFTFALIALGYPQTSDVFFDKEKLSEDLIHYNRY